MKALLLNKPFDMRVMDCPDPQIGETDVLIRVSASGICAGDLHCYAGKSPYVIYPQICGHEISGVIAAKGGQAGVLKEGTAVTIEPFISCGTCYPCRIGKRNCCSNLSIIGVHRPGGYAEMVVVPAIHVYEIPEMLDIRKAALAEPVTVALHACQRA